MRSKKFRCIYEDRNHNKYRFSCFKFKQAVREYRDIKAAHDEKINLGEIYNLISIKANVSEEAVKNWHVGNNGPSDFSTVKIVADVLNIDFIQLLEMDTANMEDLNKTMMVKDIISTDEKDIIRSILNDYIEIINDFGPSSAYEFIPFTEENGEIYYDKWVCKLNTKLMMNRWKITEENFNKLFTLFCEVKFFVTRMNRGFRWAKIEPMFEYIFHAKEYDEEPCMDWDTYIHQELDENDCKIVEANVEEVYQGDFCLDSVVYVYGFIIGKWFLNVLIHDFPELFV